MTNKIIKVIPYLCLTGAILLFFRNIFTLNSVSFGDAPYFYPKGLSELVNGIFVWTSRGINMGGVNLSLWLYPLMLLFGVLGTFLRLGNEIILRLLFYFPSILLAATGSWLFTKHLKLSKTSSLFCSLIYTLNTYFLLLIDGGQLGVALAYGVFPYALISLLKLTEKFNHKTLLIGILINFFLVMADPRVAIICFLTAILIKPGRSLVNLIPAIVVLTGLSSYWLIPVLKIQSNVIGDAGPNLNFNTLSNSLFLFQPHWPANIFGKTSPPAFYFAITPFLISIGIFLKSSKKTTWLTLLFLIFAFLSKGGSDPFGAYYLFIQRHIPLGQAFRDSSKFFIPLVLLAGLLIGNTVSNLTALITNFKIKALFESFIFLSLLLILYPAFQGRLNFNLSGKHQPIDYFKIYMKIKDDNSFFRTAWLPERSSYGYSTEENPGLDGKDLVNLRPLANLNAGEDVFNFFNNKDYVNWFRLFGIKYLILTEDPRNPFLGEKDIESKNKLIDLLSNDKNLVSLNFGNSNKIFQIKNTLPRVFYTNKIYAVVGPDDKANTLSPTVFLEDGKFDPAEIVGVSPNAFEIVLNGKSQVDLTLSYLQRYLVSPVQSKITQWAYYDPSQYLKWKYELLIRGINTHELDFNKGVAFSSQSNEKISFNLNVPDDGKYILALRVMAGENSQPLSVNFNDEEHKLVATKQNLFEWNTNEYNLKKGNHELTILNSNGFWVLNTLALIPNGEFDKTSLLSSDLIKNFVPSKNDKMTSQYVEANYEKINQTEYKVTSRSDNYWVIFNENYNSGWKLRHGQEYFTSVPLFSTINAFYIDPSWSDTEIVYKPQEYARWGIYFTLLTAIVAAIIFIATIKKNKK